LNRLAIDFDHVTEVLLADGWHAARRGSVDFGDYEYVKAGRIAEDVGLCRGRDAALTEFGFTFQEIREASPEVILAGPVTSILAVRYQTNRKSVKPAA